MLSNRGETSNIGPAKQLPTPWGKPQTALLYWAAWYNEVPDCDLNGLVVLV
jgi:hypothetical protein